MNSDTTENAIEAIEILEQKNFEKKEILALLKALDDRNREKIKDLDLITWKQVVWIVSVVGTILAFLILTYPGALQQYLTSGASPLS